MRTLLLLTVLLCFASQNAFSATYYVSPTGSDSSNGSAAKPWLTLQRAANVVSVGDTVLVFDGTYAGFEILTSGTSGSPITFRAMGNAVVVNSVGSSRGDNVSVEANYIVIEGFISEKASRAGFCFLPPRDDNEGFGCEIRNCIARNNGRWGIFTGFAAGIVIENNECYGSGLEHGIYVSCTSDGPVLRGNVCHDNTLNGIQTNGANTGWGDHVINFALYEGNVAYHNSGKGFSVIATSDSIIRNNLVYENGPAAGGIHFAPQNGMQSVNNVVINNTVIEPGMTAVRLSNASSGIEIFNNVLCGGTRAIAVEDPAWAAPGFASDYNVLCGDFVWEPAYPTFAEWQALTFDTHSTAVTSASDVCNNPATDDYRLFAGSPAIDAGIASFSGNNAPTYDIHGLTRPGGSGYDAGCYEFDGLDIAPPQVLFNLIQITGTVSDDSGIVELFIDGSSALMPVGAWESAWLVLSTPRTIQIVARDASSNTRIVNLNVSF
jgi:parallel beta-helix repeat protein